MGGVGQFDAAFPHLFYPTMFGSAVSSNRSLLSFAMVLVPKIQTIVEYSSVVVIIGLGLGAAATPILSCPISHWSALVLSGQAILKEQKS